MRFSLNNMPVVFSSDNITAFYELMIAATTLFCLNKKSLPILTQSPINGTLNVL